ncbi:MAG: extracellular solute-binding protein [Clostridia bacterium]|nr:extracellular solute-binding protein [Clostridia bacterium]
MNKKKLLLLSAALATAACAVSGCGSAGQEASEQGNKLTYWVPFYAHYQQLYTNYSEVPFFQELQKRTNVEIEFVHPTVGQEAQSFSLMVASSNLSDIIEYSISNYKGGPQKAISDNVILDLTDSINEKAPNLTKILKENDDWRKLVSTDSGQYFCFPAIRGDASLTFWLGPQIRKDYLEKIGMERPETIEEWETVLTAFKDQLDIKYPLTVLNSDHAQLMFASAFNVTGANGFYLDGDTVKYGPLEDGYEKYLRLMNDWYKKGIIDPDFAVQDSKTFDAKVSSGEAGAYVNSVGGGMGKFITATKQNNPDAKLQAVKYPVVQKGTEPRFGFSQTPFIDAQSAMISTSCKNTDAAIRLLDYAYGPEGHMFYNFGIEGTSYTMENDYPKYTDDITSNAEGLSMQNAMSRYCRAAVMAPMIQDARYFEQYQATPEQKETAEIWKLSDTNWQMPPVTLTTEEANKVSSKQNEIITYVNETSLKFIMGAEPLENLEKFRNTIKDMGIDSVLSVQQDAYNRFKNR